MAKINEKRTLFFAPERVFERLATQKPTLEYKNEESWHKKAQAKLNELLFGTGKIPRAIYDPLFIKKGTQSYRIEFLTEPDSLVIGRLELPPTKTKVPLIICLQGHTLDRKGKSVGIDSLFGEGTKEDREYYLRRGINTAEQALALGYATLAIEQRGFGERKDQRDSESQAHYGGRCHNPSMGSILYGRTIIGDRVRDVSAFITTIIKLTRAHQLPIDITRIALVGHSGGGTTAYYAAATDTRIKAVMASGSVCQFDQSIAMIDHCVCNYIPHIREYFEIGDIGCLIAPRPLIIVHGEHDPNFPIAGVRKALVSLKKAYKDRHAKSNLSIVLGDGVHQFFPELAWPAFNKISGWK